LLDRDDYEEQYLEPEGIKEIEILSEKYQGVKVFKPKTNRNSI
jgi:hypothetical protein